MSTLKTANIQDTSGNNNSTPEQISQGRAKAWINFDGTAASIGSGRKSYNVNSVTDNGAGDYTITFTTAMVDANYSVVWTVGPDVTSGSPQIVIPRMTNYSAATNTYQAQTTTAVRVCCCNIAGTQHDTVVGNLVVFN